MKTSQLIIEQTLYKIPIKTINRVIIAQEKNFQWWHEKDVAKDDGNNFYWHDFYGSTLVAYTTGKSLLGSFGEGPTTF